MSADTHDGAAPDAPLICWVYRCDRRAETYLYLAREDDFKALPAALRTTIGPLTLVMQLSLDAGRKLARADTGRVIADLRAQGYYLQLPPGHMPFDGPSAASH